MSFEKSHLEEETINHSIDEEKEYAEEQTQQQELPTYQTCLEARLIKEYLLKQGSDEEIASEVIEEMHYDYHNGGINTNDSEIERIVQEQNIRINSTEKYKKGKEEIKQGLIMTGLGVSFASLDAIVGIPSPADYVFHFAIIYDFIYGGLSILGGYLKIKDSKEL